MVGAFPVPRGAAPRGPRLPGGGPHFSREMGRKRAGALPLDPGFYGPLAAARSFWRLCHIVPVAGLLRYPCTCPDLETFFHKMLFQHIFPGNASQIGLRISEETAPRTDPGQQSPKRASANERPLTQGGRGPSPATLCVRAFSRESLDPRPGPGGKPPRRCQPAPVPVGAATDDGDPQGAAPRGTVRATTTQRVRSTLSGSRPESGGKPPRRC